MRRDKRTERLMSEDKKRQMSKDKRTERQMSEDKKDR